MIIFRKKNAQMIEKRRILVNNRNDKIENRMKNIDDENRCAFSSAKKCKQ